MTMSRIERLTSSREYLSGARFTASDALRAMSNRHGPQLTVSMAHTVLQRACDAGLIIKNGDFSYSRRRPDLFCMPWRPTRQYDNCTPRYY
jgi:hypothetical protein